MASSDVKSPIASAQSLSSGSATGKQAVSRMATIQDDDERLLAQIGYEQVRSSFPLSRNGF